ncbi:MAG: hypothetical protein WDO56_09715 [Gammaproteobacteria bacterium]
MTFPTNEQRGAGDGYKCSPDHEYCLISLVKGNLEAGVNVYSLRLYRTEDLRTYVNSKSQKATVSPVKEIARFETDGADPGIDEVAWTESGDKIRFIGRGKGERARGQVFEIDTKSLVLRQLTRSSHAIVKYAASANADTIVYAARVRRAFDETKRYGYVVTNETFSDLVLADSATTAYELQFFVSKGQSGVDVRLPIDEPSITPSGLSIAPSGRWAIVTRSPRGIPSEWTRYDYIRQFYGSLDPVEPRDRRTQKGGIVSELDRYGRWFGAIYVMDLVDLQDFSVHPLLNAPATRGAGIWWAPGDSRVLLTDTYLPLRLCSGVSAAGCSTPLSIIVPLSSGADPVVVPLQAERGLPSKVRSVSWDQSGGVIVQQQVRRGANQELSRLTFQAVGDRYELATRDHQGQQEVAGIQLQTREGPNTPPQIWAVDGSTGRSRQIEDLNPQLIRIDLGRVSDFSWRSEKLDKKIEGGLLLPPNYEKGKRYPAVLQIYGFPKELFQTSGPSTTAYAARPIANTGMVVLQFGCPTYGPWTGDYRSGSENGRAMTCIESAIDALDHESLIDRNRVGLVAFSHAGLYVMHTVTFSEYPIAAAVIADSAANTPLNYTLAYGTPRPGSMQMWDAPMTTGASMMGSPPIGVGMQNWIAESPVFHLDRVHAAIRFEHIMGFPGYWDIYAILKRMEKPAELVSYPGEMHSLQTPSARYNSQQGSVDWLRFWLTGEERVSEETKEQYERWREFRDAATLRTN